jgi:hypothetical protein
MISTSYGHYCHSVTATKDLGASHASFPPAAQSSSLVLNLRYRKTLFFPGSQAGGEVYSPIIVTLDDRHRNATHLHAATIACSSMP